MRGLDLPPEHLAIVLRILAEHVPGAEVWAYGSRVSGLGHAGSDLDLVVREPGPHRVHGSLTRLRAAFQESYLPFLVEVHEWARIPDSFREEILREHVILTAKPNGAVREKPDEP